ncbi:hypothetical protein Z517_00465 [Fonsecaea pedrosoi CBS 271.37]|uniref:Unplaced genomic scaffold supercont1.1, whole genome shotgun sequence n=1 Tax=Fonsecaea pedrosoi CBS 271.37 TaxID=1442368 RepID=A0A0D2FEM4_9EURO|nr:uncharacterized protein Z517_00465 [Fonsecaea pedrosoi CBS 271.37]KIW85077.1 hypothetical protein Z517_00465 [Fonsecaea pedrosoi CBS 271.37]
MVFPKRQMDGRSSSRSPSPSDSIESVLSSSSTLISSPDSSSAPPSPSSAVPTPSSMYSSLGTRPRRPTPPSRLLGAIDEDSSTVQPDLPLSSDSEKNPVAKLHVYAAVVNSKQRPTLALSTSPPANDFDRVMGPRGERFADLRMNRKIEGAKGWKRFMCFGDTWTIPTRLNAMQSSLPLATGIGRGFQTQPIGHILTSGASRSADADVTWPSEDFLLILKLEEERPPEGTRGTVKDREQPTTGFNEFVRLLAF